MSTGELLSIEPTELKFQFELRKQISSTLQLSNKTDNHVAFKVKTTNPKKYCVRPNTGVVSPRSTCDIMVTMQAQKEAPPDMQCKDKFLLQSVISPAGVSAKDITPEMFSKEAGHVVEECKLKVVYVAPPQPPSPVAEGSEEGSSPRASHMDNGNSNNSEVSRSFVDSHDKSSERELVLCSHEILASNREAVALSALTCSSLCPTDVSSESATTSLKGYTDDYKSGNEAIQRSDDITVDSTIAGKRRIKFPVSMDNDQKTDDSSTSQQYHTRVHVYLNFSILTFTKK